MDVLELGLRELEGLRDKEDEALGLELLDGLRLPLGLAELEGLKDAEGDELTELEGLREALGLRDTEKLCIEIIHVSVVKPVTFLNS